MNVKPHNLPAGPKALWDWIERRRITQREAARIIGIDHTDLCKILNLHRGPGLANALAIERGTGIPVEAWEPTRDGKRTAVTVGVGAKRRIGK